VSNRPDWIVTERIGVMPNKPKTPSRNVRVDDELWNEALRISSERGETVADVIRAALTRYVKKNRSK